MHIFERAFFMSNSSIFDSIFDSLLSLKIFKIYGALKRIEFQQNKAFFSPHLDLLNLLIYPIHQISFTLHKFPTNQMCKIHVFIPCQLRSVMLLFTHATLSSIEDVYLCIEYIKPGIYTGGCNWISKIFVTSIL